jgi:hypothetical protein
MIIDGLVPWMRPVTPAQYLGGVLVVALASAGASAVSYVVIEVPFARIKWSAFQAPSAGSGGINQSLPSVPASAISPSAKVPRQLTKS